MFYLFSKVNNRFTYFSFAPIHKVPPFSIDQFISIRKQSIVL
jgi:hypothetical protein